MPVPGETPLAAALAALGLSAADAERLAVEGDPGVPSSRLPVEAVGVACVGAALLAAVRLRPTPRTPIQFRHPPVPMGR